jgi:hypothetical protein
MAMPRHPDLPPGSRRWAEEVDRLERRLAEVEAQLARALSMLRIDPREPQKNINPQGYAPAVTAPDQMKVSQLADVASHNVLHGQVLTWDQQAQAWKPTNLQGAVYFVPEDEMLENMDVVWGDDRQAIGHQTGAEVGQYAIMGTDDREIFLATYEGLGTDWYTRYGRKADFYMTNGYLALHGYEDDPARSQYPASGHLTVGHTGIDMTAYEGADGSWGKVTMWADGGLRIPICTTAGRPSASATAMKGTIFYDQTINKPIFSNGSEWRDFTDNPA